MCGIAGIYSFDRNNHENFENQILNMTNSQTHRGPDSYGIYNFTDINLSFGHRRLSILDLSENGNQPMESPNSRYVITFNGEIYNHLKLREEIVDVKWRGSSDTETLLACFDSWGFEKTISKISGMFSFGLFDKKEKKLYLSIDRAGEKPLYYSFIQNKLIFSSELKAFNFYNNFKKNIDKDSLATFMKLGYIPAPNTIYKDVYKVEPGTYITIYNNSKHEVKKYWTLDNNHQNKSSYYNDKKLIINNLEELLIQSINEQMISDVPIGAFLSGGIDSSLITAIMQSLSDKPINTFSIGFVNKDYDESLYSNRVAKYLRTNHHEKIIGPKDCLDIIPKLSQIYDEPFGDSSSMPTYLLSKLAKESVTVSLSGDGADELFGGYERYYRGMAYWRILSAIPIQIRKYIRYLLLSLPANSIDKINNRLFTTNKLGYKIHKIASSLDARNTKLFLQSLVSYWNDTDNLVINGNCNTTSYHTVSPDNFDDLKSYAMFCDFNSYLPGDILTKVDRASMSVGLECRSPYLNKNVIEFSNRLPINYKIRNGTSKWILKKILYKYLPKQFFERPKTGFSVPIDSWLRGPLKSWASELINPKRLIIENNLNAKLVEQRWQALLNGEKSYQYQLWNVLIFQQWLNDN